MMYITGVFQAAVCFSITTCFEPVSFEILCTGITVRKFGLRQHSHSHSLRQIRSKKLMKIRSVHSNTRINLLMLANSNEDFTIAESCCDLQRVVEPKVNPLKSGSNLIAYRYL